MTWRWHMTITLTYNIWQWLQYWTHLLSFPQRVVWRRFVDTLRASNGTYGSNVYRIIKKTDLSIVLCNISCNLASRGLLLTNKDDIPSPKGGSLSSSHGKIFGFSCHSCFSVHVPTSFSSFFSDLIFMSGKESLDLVNSLAVDVSILLLNARKT